MRAWLASLPWALGLAFGACALGCSRPTATHPATAATPPAAPIARELPSSIGPAPVAAATPPASERDPVALAEAPTLIEVGAHEAPAVAIGREFAAAEAAGQSALVYVGAEWCAPCKVFRAALVAGELASALPRLRFIGLDHDHHGEGLRALGYDLKYVPMFAFPGPGGRATGLGFGGVPMEVKDAPVAHLVARIGALVGKPPRPPGDSATD